VELGSVGLWNRDIGLDTPQAREAVAELDELGYSAVWIGGSPPVAAAAQVLAATTRLKVATGILNIWQHKAADVAAQTAAVNKTYNGRFLLGLGASHAAAVPGYAKPYTAMVNWLDELDAAGHPADERVLAALGPKMLALSRDRADGAHPYLVTPEHTARARDILGAGKLLAPELKVILATDADRARQIAREHLAIYLQLPNYLNSLRTLGFEDADFADGGSDRFVDVTVAWGDEDAIADRVRQHLDAGADHVTVQVLGDPLPRAEWRSLAGLTTVKSSR
jgi:probable F420-dependent oxidoreductase